MTEPLLHIVLYQPDIPQNTGNIGRTCVAVGAKLWLIRPLGFRLDEKHLKRAGMDYWPHLDWQVVESWDELTRLLPDRNYWFIEECGDKLVWDGTYSPGDVLVFGSETRGIPPGLMAQYPGRVLKFPMRENVRSLNLASTATAAIYEAMRQLQTLD